MGFEIQSVTATCEVQVECGNCDYVLDFDSCDLHVHSDDSIYVQAHEAAEEHFGCSDDWECPECGGREERLQAAREAVDALDSDEERASIFAHSVPCILSRAGRDPGVIRELYTGQLSSRNKMAFFLSMLSGNPMDAKVEMARAAIQAFGVAEPLNGCEAARSIQLPESTDGSQERVTVTRYKYTS